MGLRTCLMDNDLNMDVEVGLGHALFVVSYLTVCSPPPRCDDHFPCIGSRAAFQLHCLDGGLPRDRP